MTRPGWLDRSFATFLVGDTISGTGTMVSGVALPLVAINSLHASTLQVGLLEAMQWLPAVLIGLPAGALVDRNQRRSKATMMAASAGRAVSVAAVPAAALLGILSMPILLAAAVVTGIFAVFFQSGYMPYLRQLLAPDDLAAGTSYLQSGRSVARISGPALGGALVVALGASTALTIDAISFLVSCAALALTRAAQPPAPPPPRQSLLADIAEGVRRLYANRLLSAVAAATAGANLFLTAIGAIEIVFLVRDVHISAGLIGALITISGVGGLAGALASSKLIDRFGMQRVAGFTFVLTAPAALLLPATHQGVWVALFAAGGFAVSCGIAIGSVALMTLRLHHCPPVLQARVGSYTRLLNAASIPIGALLGGTLGQYLGTRPALILLAAGYICFGIALTRSPLTTPTPEPAELTDPSR